VSVFWVFAATAAIVAACGGSTVDHVAEIGRDRVDASSDGSADASEDSGAVDSGGEHVVDASSASCNAEGQRLNELLGAARRCEIDADVSQCRDVIFLGGDNCNFPIADTLEGAAFKEAVGVWWDTLRAECGNACAFLSGGSGNPITLTECRETT